MKKNLLIIFGTLFIIILAAAIYYGLFNSPKLVEKNVGGETFVYQERFGDYQQSGPAMDTVYQELKNNFGLECPIGFGIYYDNPQEVAKENLRSDVGCVLSNESLDRLSEIQTSSILKTKRIPVVKYITTEFPYRNKISFALGVLKIYPKFSKYLSEHNYQSAPSMELYDIKGHRIEYRMAVVEK